MLRVQVPLLLLIVSLVIGCQRQSPSVDGTYSPPTSKDLAARLEAARLIHSVIEQDDALADLAKDAARVGDGDITKETIKAIRTTNVRDNAAAEAAVLLARNGKSAEATEVAKLIHQTSLCDKTLATIAKGD